MLEKCDFYLLKHISAASISSQNKPLYILQMPVVSDMVVHVTAWIMREETLPLI